MQTLFLIAVVAAFAFFAAVVMWAEIYTRDVRAKWTPAGVRTAREEKESLAPRPTASADAA